MSCQYVGAQVLNFKLVDLSFEIFLGTGIRIVIFRPFPNITMIMMILSPRIANFVLFEIEDITFYHDIE